MTEPVLPYPDGDRHTSGWSGSDTSRQRAHDADDNGSTRRRQWEVLHLLDHREDRGATWREIASLTQWHHGQVSGALSNLHKVSAVARLVEKRNGCKVYVLPEYVNGRDTEQQGRRAVAS